MSTSAETLGTLSGMKEYQLIVFNEPDTPGAEDEFGDWCDHQLISALLRMPGFLSAQRFVITAASPNNVAARHFILFGLRSKDIEATNTELLRIQLQGTMPLTALKNGTIAFMEPIGPTVLPARSQAPE